MSPSLQLIFAILIAQLVFLTGGIVRIGDSREGRGFWTSVTAFALNLATIGGLAYWLTTVS